MSDSDDIFDWDGVDPGPAGSEDGSDNFWYLEGKMPWLLLLGAIVFIAVGWWLLGKLSNAW